MLFSDDLKKFLSKLSEKPRLHMSNVIGADFQQEIEMSMHRLGISNLRQLIYHVQSDTHDVPTCTCGNKLKWNYNRYLQYCSVKCSVINTTRDRQATMIERYGHDNFAKTASFKEKSTTTFIEKYGVSNPSKSPLVQQKKITTNRTRYLADNFSQSHLSPETIKIINDRDNFIEFAKGKTIAEVADALGMSGSGPIKVAKRFGIIDAFVASTRSKYESMIEKLLDSINVNYVKNSKKIIPPLQLDFYIPDKNLAIEVGSMYFHCELSSGRGRRYHHEKWKKCKEKGITLLQYFDDDLLDKWEIVESKIKRLCHVPSPVVGARKVVIKSVSSTDEKKFLNRYHLQGSNLNRTHAFGAYYDQSLVAIFSVKVKKVQAEIVRFAVDGNHSYPGLFTKMLAHFIKTTNFAGNIFSFSDNRHGNGNLYRSSGFELEAETAPGYSYTRNYLKKENRLRYQKHILVQKHQGDINKTEWQIMQELGYDRIWDAGQSKWIKRVG